MKTTFELFLELQHELGLLSFDGECRVYAGPADAYIALKRAFAEGFEAGQEEGTYNRPCLSCGCDEDKYCPYHSDQLGEGGIKRDLSTPESRKFWDSCEAASKEVLTWPDWKRAGINTAPALSEPRELPPKEKLLNLSTEELEAELRKK